MICLTSVSWFQAHSVLPYMGFVSLLFSLKGCAQMAFASHHIHLNLSSQLTKQAPQGWRGTDSHLLHPLPTPSCLYTNTGCCHHHYKDGCSAWSSKDSLWQTIAVIASVFLEIVLKSEHCSSVSVNLFCDMWVWSNLQGSFKAKLAAHMFSLSMACICCYISF